MPKHRSEYLVEGKRRPSRAKMCNWLADELRRVRGIVPTNPADISLLSQNAALADRKLGRLSDIVDELGWHADADLESAWQLIREYDQDFGVGEKRS